MAEQQTLVDISSITKVLAAKEDLLTGIGKETQKRVSGDKEVTRINVSELNGAVVVTSFAELRQLDPTLLTLKVVIVTYGDTAGDNLGGLFVWEGSNQQTEDSKHIITNPSITTGRWVRQGNSFISGEDLVVDNLEVLGDSHFAAGVIIAGALSADSVSTDGRINATGDITTAGAFIGDSLSVTGHGIQVKGDSNIDGALVVSSGIVVKGTAVLENVDIDSVALETINTKIATTEASVAAMQTSVANIQTTVDTLNTSVSNLDTKLATEITTTDAEQAAQDSAISVLQTNQTSQAATIASIQTEQSEQNDRLTTNEADIADGKTRIAALETSQSTQDANIESARQVAVNALTEASAIKLNDTAQDKLIEQLQATDASQTANIVALNEKLNNITVDASGFDYIQSGIPTVTINPTKENATYLDIATGQTYVCKDITTDANVWVGGYILQYGINYSVTTWAELKELVTKYSTYYGQKTKVIIALSGTIEVDSSIYFENVNLTHIQIKFNNVTLKNTAKVARAFDFRYNSTMPYLTGTLTLDSTFSDTMFVSLSFGSRGICGAYINASAVTPNYISVKPVLSITRGSFFYALQYVGGKGYHMYCNAGELVIANYSIGGISKADLTVDGGKYTRAFRVTQGGEIRLAGARANLTTSDGYLLANLLSGFFNNKSVNGFVGLMYNSTPIANSYQQELYFHANSAYARGRGYMIELPLAPGIGQGPTLEYTIDFGGILPDGYSINITNGEAMLNVSLVIDSTLKVNVSLNSAANFDDNCFTFYSVLQIGNDTNGWYNYGIRFV